ncbi:PREDICTED: serine protease snake-like isoform X1 [Rhagoletis zephyria]|uniref:serine protease snake-like isoform X1 n=1 Tax=Rhagoletis zephyria TaxID=28612 RepID=UPI0008117CF8|nr:PREDICTED: serine protease snake-like isoform X1 [Rhagoletis zephyria]
MKRLRANSSRLPIFISFQILILAVFLEKPRLSEGCYKAQECYTPLNVIGFYYTKEDMQRLTEKQKAQCEGHCQDGNNTLTCCALGGRPEKHRLLYQSCLDAHLPSGFITFGVVAEPNEFPYMAAIGWRVRDQNGTESIAYRCGGTLIDSRYLLTAAHCLYHSSDPPVVVRPGGFDLNSTTATDYDIDQIIEHPNYEYPAVYNDIALIRMTKVFLSDSPIVARACIWYGSLAEEQLTAIGYGDTQFAGASSPLLMKTSLSTITNEECSTYYEQDEDLLSSGVIATQLCAKDHAKLRDTCQGDSGGPLIRYENIEDYDRIAYIVGVTSFGIGCGTGTPGIYTRVSEYFDWIEEQVYK